MQATQQGILAAHGVDRAPIGVGVVAKLMRPHATVAHQRGVRDLRTVGHVCQQHGARHIDGGGLDSVGPLDPDGVKAEGGVDLAEDFLNGGAELNASVGFHG